MKKYQMETAVGVFVVAGLICIAYLSVRFGNVSLLHDRTYTLCARVTSVEGLRVGSPVDVFGIEVGKISSLDVDNERQAALVTMKVDKSVKTYSDASASIKTMGIIGDKYVKIDPGGAGTPLKSGDTITNTSSPPDIEDLLGRYIFGQASAPEGGGGREK